MNPAEYSLRELQRMSNGKRSHDWDMFALLICYAANPHMKKGRTLKFKDVHPFYNKQMQRSRNEYMTEEEFRRWLYN